MGIDAGEDGPLTSNPWAGNWRAMARDRPSRLGKNWEYFPGPWSRLSGRRTPLYSRDRPRGFCIHYRGSPREVQGPLARVWLLNPVNKPIWRIGLSPTLENAEASPGARRGRLTALTMGYKQLPQLTLPLFQSNLSTAAQFTVKTSIKRSIYSPKTVRPDCRASARRRDRRVLIHRRQRKMTEFSLVSSKLLVS